jgi:hypothetical protein
MAQRLENAISEARKLPDLAQDAIAALILEQMADDRAWDESFVRSQDKLAKLARKVREDVAAGTARSLSDKERVPSVHH